MADEQKHAATVAITGANRGLGLEMARQFSARGDKVYALCRKTSPELDALGVNVIQGVDVTKDAVGEVLRAALDGVTLDILVNNAGGYGAVGEASFEMLGEQKLTTVTPSILLDAFNLNTVSVLRVTQALLPLIARPGGKIILMTSLMGSISASFEMWGQQKLTAVTPSILLDTFNLNTVSVLRVTQALLPLIARPGGKIILMTSLMGSISDNGSGGHYGYRCAKAAMNMMGKSMALDLKDEGISVGLVHPGAVTTGFVGDPSKVPAKMKAHQRDVVTSTKGVLEAIDATSLDTTGNFTHANYGEGLKPCQW
eukprot:CAMPEP_0205833730 /NCGR_PEP_ID=MMETSP0206-20130828/50225_1 /ASSEMBLY_ACC=CAM_ASM_000279 /TAXON_ID=36767 /ORGANISM="Euplotes focardii, Strain TN1" /LENGTH=311 /DNA_ID=CAMNT_0053140375 /DNA_START=26 /DNA_END=961 /DNA_ORIENTATION=+